MDLKKVYGNNVAVVGRITGETPETVIELLSRDHDFYLINPDKAGKVFYGRKVFSRLTDISDKINTVIFYIRPELNLKERLYEDLEEVDLVVFPPGSESHELTNLVEEKGIEVKLECPRVRLSLLYSNKS